MSSRFVSGGQIDAKGAAVTPTSDPTAPTSKPPPLIATSNKKSEEWAAVQAQLESDRLRRQEQLQKQHQQQQDGGERSLFEILQANKAAKQAAFEEANKIKNQFRALDDDEIGFLDEVRERARAEEESQRRETEEGLRVFREAQLRGSSSSSKAREAEGGGEAGVGVGAVDDEVVEDWAVSGRRRKRRREREGVIKGVKRRASEQQTVAKVEEVESVEGGGGKTTRTTITPVTTKLPSKFQKVDESPRPRLDAVKPKPGLVDYGSDEDSD